MNQTGKRTAVFVLLLLVVFSACRKPPEPSSENTKPDVATKSNVQDSIPDSDLASSVTAILRAAHRGGSLVYRAECGSQRRFTEVYPLNPPIAPEPMDQALAEISRRYPSLQWKESIAGRVRVTDRSARTGLLKVRIPEFAIIDDRDPDEVITTIWTMPEVKAFIRKNRLQIAPPRKRAGASRRSRGPVAVHLKNATVAEILDAVLASYKDGASRVWVYHECHGQELALVEVRVI